MRPLAYLSGVVCVSLCLSFFPLPQSISYAQEKPVLTKDLFERGKNLYQKQCAVCHGPEGQADGKAAFLLSPKPRNFVADKFRLVSTTNMEATDEDLYTTITRGMPGSAMPPWEHLSSSDRWALIWYVRYLSQSQQDPANQEAVRKDEIPWDKVVQFATKTIAAQDLIQLTSEPAVSPEGLQRGKELFAASCAGCHGPTGKGDGGQQMIDKLGYNVRPRDLTAGIFKGSSSSEDLYKRMVGGLPGSPMPGYTGALTQEQIWDLIHFVQKLSDPAVQQKTRLSQMHLKAIKIKEDLAADPAAAYWQSVAPAEVSLTPLWWRDDRIEDVQVKAVHNGKQLALLLSWKDATQDEEVVRLQSFSDGAAVQFSAEKDPPFFGMGQSGSPVYIWHWKAVWEHAGDDRRDVEHANQNMAVDWYPAQKNYKYGSAFEVKDSKTSMHDPKFMTGWGAGNPVSDPGRSASAEQAAAAGLGSYTTQVHPKQEVLSKGVYREGRWSVVFVRSLKSNDPKDLQLKSRQTVSAAFAVWDGSHKDRNGEKMVSIWNQLILE